MTKRIGVIAILQESNTFIAERTTVVNFEQDSLFVGEEVRRRLRDAHHEVGGFFEGLERAGLIAVPILFARALPSGTMTDETLQTLMESLQTELCRAGQLDGVLAAPHGATVSESIRDVDGHWLAAVRRSVGPNCPIIATLDPHANLSQAMLDATDAILPYRTNPHLDQRERGVEASRLMAETLAGRIRPVQAAVMLPLAINIECQATSEEPLRSIYERAQELRGRPGILSTDICLGFPYADVPEMGAATLAIADGDVSLAESTAQDLAQLLWERRQQFCPEFISVDAALDVAQARFERGDTGPICLLDMGDNVGAGSAADGTILTEAIDRRRIAGAFAVLCDPGAIAQLAPLPSGADAMLDVGGKTDDKHGAPFRASVTVLGHYDGKFREFRPSHGGIAEFDQGPTAVVRTAHGTTLMLTTRRMAPWSLSQLRSCDLDPKSFRLLVAKGVHSPLGAYREVCQEFIRVNTAGSTSADLSTFDYLHRRRPMFPFDPTAEWSPSLASIR